MALADALEIIPEDTFAVRLAIVRAHLGGLNIRRAAELCDINHENWRRYESGKLPRDLQALCRKISAATGISYKWLMVGGELKASARKYSGQDHLELVSSRSMPDRRYSPTSDSPMVRLLPELT